MEKFITVWAFDKDSSKSITVNLLFENDFDVMKKQVQEFFNEVPFSRYYYEIECQDVMEDNEMEIVELLNDEF